MKTNRRLIFFLFFMLLLNSFCSNTKNKDMQEERSRLIFQAQKKVDELKLNDVLYKSSIAIICRYEKEEIQAYDSIGILNYKLTFLPIATLKGNFKLETLYLHVHSPGLQNIGHEENYKKIFIIFLSDDKFNDSHYAEGIDFNKAVKLDE